MGLSQKKKEKKRRKKKKKKDGNGMEVFDFPPRFPDIESFCTNEVEMNWADRT